ncbi:GNAT family N-acetyltransferase [Dongia sp.]|uniref:GNAT family N-acetyltransferase n=1 Tax=Dongia sp. TaxID=1977262 RepID=UPI0035B4140C
MSFRPLSLLSVGEQHGAAGIVSGNGLSNFYWSTAIEDLECGIDNRLFRFSADGAGLVLGAAFGDLTVFSFAGTVSDADIAACIDRPGAVELHAPVAERERYEALAGGRWRQTREMVIMSAMHEAISSADGRCRSLGPSDADEVAAFYRLHHSETVFDPYMLEMPFVGAFDRGRLVACAGTVAQSRALRTSLIGHFATAEDRRGQGLATAVGGELLALLGEIGFETVYLATTSENEAALGVYRRLGFGTIDRRAQLDLTP